MAPPGLLPQSVTVIMQGDLVNRVKPGDRVQMIGIFKLISGAQSKEKGIFKPYFLCLSVKPLAQTTILGKMNMKLPVP
jgi:DNA replication licensing factor MCM3